MSYKLSQLAPLPRLKNVEVGKTIGHGGFGVVKSAVVEKNGVSKIIAVKFVHIEMARQQNVTTETLAKEALIQKECRHPNIIQLIDFGADVNWVWFAMELGANGELFDKIEPDLGVDEDVAQFYFNQLTNAILFIHGKGVAHRDIKPENLVIDKNGNLKLTDFGLASVFRKKNGSRRMCTTACGSPPYLAPEVVSEKYDPEPSDIWSCCIVLFVLLTGQIAWEMPHMEDQDYKYYVASKGEVLISPWNRIPLGALSLLRKVLVADPARRLNLHDIKKHPWVSKKNKFADDRGMCKDPTRLTTSLLVNLYINLSDAEFNKVTQLSTQMSRPAAGTQPQGYLMDDMHNSEIYKENYKPIGGFSASQEVYTEHSKRRKLKKDLGDDEKIFSTISKDPASFQFLQSNSIVDRTELINAKMSSLQVQQQRYPALFAENLTRFFSVVPPYQLLVTILESLHKLGLHGSSTEDNSEEYVADLQRNDLLNGLVTIPISGRDSSKAPILGNVRVSRLADNLDARKVEFFKIKADPLEWRRVFKRVTILCRDVVYVEK
ncbi:hypothetical protein OGAPHI_005002 [Ogataea philodendri]|uniref:non-specific serine/threonine protein kinase n=1 Tax=Ogataea philodendri TaxID=1378263 RepID=A0A9P8T2F3_9ASCO|nr:uncharacterized protein OGAPHI_005002 [Ogataea philodendri]KAH3663601.1 hypothetical protein OGAPHI_005002 [Ogataea philodendri]